MAMRDSCTARTRVQPISNYGPSSSELIARSERRVEEEVLLAGIRKTKLCDLNESM